MDTIIMIIGDIVEQTKKHPHSNYKHIIIKDLSFQSLVPFLFCSSILSFLVTKIKG